MLKPTDGKIGTREVLALYFITIASKATDMTPTLLLQGSKNAAWLVPLWSALITSVPFLCLFWLLKTFHNKNIVEIAYQVLGRWLGFLVGLILFAISLGSTVLNSRNYVDIVSTFFYPTTPLIFLYALLILSSFYVANRGLEAIGRVSWALTPLFLGILGLLLGMSLFDVRWQFLTPLLGPGLPVLAMNGLHFSALYWELLALAVLFPLTRSLQTYRVGALLGLSISLVVLTSLTATYVMVYDVPSVEFISYPFHQLTRSVRLGRFLARTEAFFLFFWIVGSTIRFAIQLYVTTALLGFTIKLSEFEPLLFPLAGLTVILGLFLENPIETALVIRQQYKFQFTSGFFLAFPLLLWVIARIRGLR